MTQGSHQIGLPVVSCLKRAGLPIFSSSPQPSLLLPPPRPFLSASTQHAPPPDFLPPSPLPAFPQHSPPSRWPACSSVRRGPRGAARRGTTRRSWGGTARSAGPCCTSWAGRWGSWGACRTRWALVCWEDCKTKSVLVYWDCRTRGGIANIE